MTESMQLCQKTIDQYMLALKAYDVDGLEKLFTKEAKIYSPLLGWVAPRIFFSKMREVSGKAETRLEPRNTCASTEGTLVIAKHFIYHWELDDGRRTTFEAVDIFEFEPNGLISSEIIIYDTFKLREDLGGNPLA